jgi:hypothetical protein
MRVQNAKNSQLAEISLKVLVLLHSARSHGENKLPAAAPWGNGRATWGPPWEAEMLADLSA